MEATIGRGHDVKGCGLINGIAGYPDKRLSHEQFPQAPDMIRDPRFHCRGNSKSLVNSAKIVVSEVQGKTLHRCQGESWALFDSKLSVRPVKGQKPSVDNIAAN
jgi:hypothetical protein